MSAVDRSTQPRPISNCGHPLESTEAATPAHPRPLAVTAQQVEGDHHPPLPQWIAPPAAPLGSGVGLASGGARGPCVGETRPRGAPGLRGR